MFFISFLSNYKLNKIIHTWRKGHIFLIKTKKWPHFLFFCSRWENHNTWSASQVTRGAVHQCLLEVPLTRVAFQRPWQANNKSINHIPCNRNSVGVTLSLLFAARQQGDRYKGHTTNCFFPSQKICLSLWMRLQKKILDKFIHKCWLK